MSSRDFVIGIMFLSLTMVGILGNFSLLYYFLVLYYNERTLKITDLILKHLIIANSLIILFKGLPHSMAAFGLKSFFGDFVCTFILYIQRVSRSVSIGTTCLLSIFQAITIIPRNSCWKDLKVKAPKYIGLSINLCWILYIVINFIFPNYVYSKWNSKNMTNRKDFEYCSSVGNDEVIDSLYAALFVFPEVLFSLFIICSSGSMIVSLHRHKQQVQHIRSRVSTGASPESRAAQCILVLVSTFVTFSTLSSILHACITHFHHPSQWLVNITALISMCFPTLSPFVLLSHDSTVSRLCFVWRRNTKSSNLIIRL